MSPTLLAIARDKFIRPSALAAIALCPARPTMEAAVVSAEGELPSSDEAVTGTSLHGFSQQGVEAWKAGSSWDDAIALACNGAAQSGHNAWDIWCLRFALEAVRDLIIQHEIEPESVLTEHTLDMVAMGFTQGGTSDVVLVKPGKLVIIAEYKFGFLDQGDADAHDQTSIYAGAAAETFACDKVEVRLIQPRAEKANRNTGATYDGDTLRANRAWTAAVIRRARVDDPELEPSYAACVHCKALTRCAAAKEHFMRAKAALELIGPPVDADARGELIGAAKLAQKWADAVIDQEKPRVIAGEAATGWKLGTPRAIRTVTQVPAAIERLEQAGMGAAAMEAVSLSLSKLPPEAADLLKDFISERVSEPSLVADRRTKATA